MFSFQALSFAIFKTTTSFKMSTQQISKTSCEKNASPLAPDANRHVLPLKHIGQFQFSLSRKKLGEVFTAYSIVIFLSA